MEVFMVKLWLVANLILVISVVLALASCSVQEDKVAKPTAPAPAAKAEAKAPTEKEPEKAKAEKTKGDVGLLDLEKNYMILVTKEGKLVTLDFDQKTKVTEIAPTPGKIADVGLGSSATVTYSTEKDKNVATGLEFKAAKGGD
jgi:glucose/arabinose dehydrogenase